jgi:uncharacterized iron-regulated protein
MLMLRLAAIVLAVPVIAADISEKNYRVYRPDGSAATIDEITTASRAAAVTFLGEQHDDPVAHYLEAEILKRAYDADLALSLEMFETDVQYVLDEYLNGLITEDHLISSARAWRNYKSDYKPMIEFARERKMSVIAANAPRRYVNRVSRLGMAALFDLPESARRFLPPLPYAKASEAYTERFRRVMEEARKQQEEQRKKEGKMEPPPQPQQNPERGLQAQSLWDASMAYSIASFLQRNPSKRVMHVNGSFHSAEHQGILEHLERYRSATKAIVVHMMTDKGFPAFDADKMAKLGDFIVLTDPSLPRSTPPPTAPPK